MQSDNKKQRWNFSFKGISKGCNLPLKLKWLLSGTCSIHRASWFLNTPNVSYPPDSYVMCPDADRWVHLWGHLFQHGNYEKHPPWRGSVLPFEKELGWWSLPFLFLVLFKLIPVFFGGEGNFSDKKTIDVFKFFIILKKKQPCTILWRLI